MEHSAYEDAFLGTLEALPCAAFLQRDGCIVERNSIATAMTGLDGVEPIAVERVFLGAYPALVEADEADAVVRFDCLLLRGSGRLVAVQGVARVVIRDGRRERLVVVLEKDSGKNAVGSEGQLLEDLLDGSPEAMAITLQGKLLYVNREFARLFGYAVDECIGQNIDELARPEDATKGETAIARLISSTGSAVLDSVRTARHGERVDVSIVVGPVRLSGSVSGLFYTFRDIRRQKQTLARYQHSALHDALTDLPNRTLLLDRLRMARARLRRGTKVTFAILFVDLDGFKAVNDTLGHGAGDLLLLEIGRRLKECVRPQDTVARLGGDEFALLLEDARSIQDIEVVVGRVHAAVAWPVQVDAGEARVSASIGVAVVEEEGPTEEEMLHRADVAMYRAKAKGKGMHEVFYNGMTLPRD